MIEHDGTFCSEHCRNCERGPGNLDESYQVFVRLKREFPEE